MTRNWRTITANTATAAPTNTGLIPSMSAGVHSTAAAATVAYGSQVDVREGTRWSPSALSALPRSASGMDSAPRPIATKPSTQPTAVS